MAEELKKYTVVQECDIGITHYLVNDTVLLTDGDAQYRLGLSIEPHPENREDKTPVGEHREKHIEVLEETRPMKDIKSPEEDDRPAKRPVRSKTASET